MWVLKVISVVLLFAHIPTPTSSAKGNAKKSDTVDVCSLWSEDWENTVELRNSIYTGVKPFGGANAGKYSKVKVKNWNECVQQCCAFDRCNVAYWISAACLHIECVSDELCEPVSGEENSDINDDTFFLQTRSVLSTAAALDFDDPGHDACNETKACPPNEHCEKVSIHAQLRRNICVCDKDKQFRRINDVCRQYFPNTKPCALYEDQSINSCVKNEECLPPTDRAKHGYCQCKMGFRRRAVDDVCVPDSTSATTHSTSTTMISELEVQAGESQTVQSPNDQIELNGRVVFRSNKSEVKLLDLTAKKLSLLWILKASPNEAKVKISDQGAASRVLVKDLHEGTYEFELTLIDEHSTTVASDTVKVEVLPAKTTTTPHPLQLFVDSPIFAHLPQQVIVIKASVQPDNRRVMFQWTYAKDGPVTPTLENVDTAQLSVSNLRPGNYSFHLRAVDNLGNEQIENVELIVDGEPIQARVSKSREVVFWPSSDVVLDGTSSIIEPHTIVRWGLLSNTNRQKTTELELSSPHSLKTMVTNLRIGEYKFQLVLMTSDRKFTSTTEVRIVVYAENGQPPQIRIHSQTNTVNILDNLVMLNASATTADYGIAKWQWTKSSLSPAAGRFLDGSESLPIAYVTHLIEGRYVFTLHVTDERQQTTTMDVNVTVDGVPNAADLFEVIFDDRSLREGKLENLLGQLRVFLVDISPNMNLTLAGIANDNVLLIKAQLADGQILSPTTIAEHLRKKIKTLRSASGVNILSINSYLCFSNCSNRGKCDRQTKKCVCNRYHMQNWFKWIVYGETNCDFVVHYMVLISSVTSVFTLVFCWFFLCFCCRYQRRQSMLARRKRIRYQLLHDDEEDNNLESPNEPKKSKTKGKFRSGQKNKGKASNTVISDSDDNAEETLYDKPLLTAKLQMSSPSSLRVPVQDSNGSPMVRHRTSDQSPTTTDHSVA